MIRQEARGCVAALALGWPMLETFAKMDMSLLARDSISEQLV
jgi:hypothetical protein